MNVKNFMKNVVLCLIFILSNELWGQKYINPERLVSNFAKRENKEKFYGNLVKNAYEVINEGYQGNSKVWIKILRDAQSILLKSETIKSGLQTVLSLEPDKDIPLQRVAVEIALTLYPESFSKEVQKILSLTQDRITFAIAANYLRKNSDPQQFLEMIDQKFKNSGSSVFLKLLIEDFKDLKYQLPPLRELFNHNFQEGKTIVYTIFRKNRKFPGITVIKKPDGEFVKNEDGSYFHIPQLGLSFSDLPFYIPNGNTPQGIYSIVGTYISPTETIGPTPNLLIRSPFEVSPEIFYHKNHKNRTWDLNDYKNLLPENWRNYEPVCNSFYAGKIGRRLIIVHGTTDEPRYFEDQIYYPLIPTRGCLSSKELWNQETGKLKDSDQVKLINAFRSTGTTKGYLVVIEIDDKQKSVSIDEFVEYLK